MVIHLNRGRSISHMTRTQEALVFEKVAKNSLSLWDITLSYRTTQMFLF